MKIFFNGLKIILAAVLLMAILLVVFQFGIKPSSGSNIPRALVSTTPSATAYPAPQDFTKSSNAETANNPYPAPDPETANNAYPITGTPFNMGPTIDCSKAGTWIEYVNQKANFSFQYPAEAEIHESVDLDGYTNITLYLKPSCYEEEWWGARQVGIYVLTNSDHLSMKEFVVEQFTYDLSTDILALSRELESVSTTVIIDNVPALQVKGAITEETPRVYIPHNDLVILVGLFEMKRMPPFEEASPGIIDLFNKIASSVVIFNDEKAS